MKTYNYRVWYWTREFTPKCVIIESLYNKSHKVKEQVQQLSDCFRVDNISIL